MTKAQEIVIRKIEKELPRFDFYNSENYEIKKFEIKETDYGPVWVSITTGLKGDKGTYAMLCRKHRFFQIGKRGGIKNFQYDGKNRGSVTLFKLLNECYTN